MWLLAFLSVPQIWAADAVTSAIEHAQSAALKKNRAEACLILKRAWQEAPANSKARTKAAEALNQISRLFFTDKGQKIFESGQAAMWDTPDIALAQFKEALILEDQNVQVLNNVARVQIFKQDCDGALQTLKSARDLNPLAGESAVLEMRAHLCKQNFEVMRDKAKTLPGLSKGEDFFAQYMLAADALRQNSYKKAFDALTKLSEADPQFPEAYFHLAHAADELNKDSEAYMQKYVSLCKAATAREKKKFSLEPRLCAHLKEAEDELAKQKSI